MNIYKIIKNYLNLIKIKFYSRKFKTFEKLEKFCANKSNYDKDTNSLFRFNKFNLNKNDIPTLYNQQYNILLTAVDKFISKYKYFPKIIDFGGGFGEGYFFLKNFYVNQYIEYNVVEIPKIVELSKEITQKILNDNLSFHTSLKDTLKGNNPDLIFSSSTLQYLKEPYKILDELNSSRSKIICLTRNSFSDKTMFYSQVSRLHRSGAGKSPNNYKDILTIHPHTVIDIKKLESIISHYKIIFREKTFEKTVFSNCFSEDLIFIIDE